MNEMGTYRYQTYNPVTRTFVAHTMPVEILKETERSYFVRFMSVHAYGYKPGDTAWVRKRNVYLPATNVPAENIRYPYKDN